MSKAASSLSEADRWRLISAALAALCLVLGLLLWTTSARADRLAQRALHALDWCTTSDEDREHL